MSFQLMAWAAQQKTGSPTRKAVLMALANAANHQTGKCNPQMDAIADETEFAERTVRSAVAELCEMGFISRERMRRADGSWTGYFYRFPATPPAGGAASPPAGGAGQEPGSKPLNQEGVSNDTLRVQETASTEVAEYVDHTGAVVPVSTRTPVVSVAVLFEWLKHPNLIQHRRAYLESKVGREKVTTLIEKRVAQYGITDVCAAIANYSTVLASPTHYWRHRWTLGDFLARGLDRFVPEAEPLEVFKTQAKRDMTPGRARETALAIGDAIARRNARDAGEKVALSGSDVYDYPDEHRDLSSEGGLDGDAHRALPEG